jgi:hypothetical protein
MQKVSLAFSPKQAEALVDQLLAQLDTATKLRLTEKLERETRRLRWEPLVLKMRQRFARHPLSSRQIRQLCETVRQERFEHRSRARRD